MIGMALKERATGRGREAVKKAKFAGIRFKDKETISGKTKHTQISQLGMKWDCSMLCLLHSGPRIYTGPL